MPAERVTLDTVARAAGVSRMTVSNAYNRPDQLSASTRLAILELARELGYPGPDPAGRSLRTGQAGTIGLLLTESLSYAFSDPGLVSLLRGLSTAIGDAGQALLLVPAEANAEHSLVRGALVDGFVLCSLTPGDPVVADVRARRLPVVTVGGARHPGITHVGIDNARAAGRMGEYLAGLGHNRFGVLTFGRGSPLRRGRLPAGADPAGEAELRGYSWTMRQRVIGFRRTCGGEVEVLQVAANTRQAAAEAALRLLAARSGRPTALFAVTDVLALGAMDAAERLGLDVPGEVSIAGFDGIEAGLASRPPLTTMAIALTEQGRAAGRTVLDLVAGRPVTRPRIVPELLVRGSAAAARRRRGTPRPVPRP